MTRRRVTRSCPERQQALLHTYVAAWNDFMYDGDPELALQLLEEYAVHIGTE